MGTGDPIGWGQTASVLAHLPSARPPARGRPDHRHGYRHWCDVGLLRLSPPPALPLPCLAPSSLPLAKGQRVAILGFGEQPRHSDRQAVTFGHVARLRFDAKTGCTVADLQCEMLGGFSGGPVIDLRPEACGQVAAYCVSSQTETHLGAFRGQLQTPDGPVDAEGQVALALSSTPISVPSRPTSPISI